MKQPIQTLPSGHKLVKRYRNGRCYACVWASDSSDDQIAKELPEAEFLPYDEAAGEFIRTAFHRPSHFRS